MHYCKNMGKAHFRRLYYIITEFSVYQPKFTQSAKSDGSVGGSSA